MRLLVTGLLAWSLLCCAVFVVDFVRGSRLPHLGLNAGDVLGSAVGSAVVLGTGLVDVAVNDPSSLWLHLAVGLFAGVGYPAWWVWMRRLRRQSG